MSIDERLFGWLFRTWRRVRARAPELSEHAVTLEPIATRLALLASALAGAAIEVRSAEGVGGLRGEQLLLPALVDRQSTAEANLSVYLLRVAYAVQTRALGLSTAGLEAQNEQVATLLAAPAIRAALARELPACTQLIAELRKPRCAEPSAVGPEQQQARAIVASLLFGDALMTDVPPLLHELLARPPAGQAALLEAVAVVQTLRIDELLTAAAEPHWLLFGRLSSPPNATAELLEPGGLRPAPPERGGTERDAPARDELEIVEIAAAPEDENPLVHSFEKVHTLDDYKGGNKREDGEDQLDEQLDALDELDLRQLIRTRETAHSVYRLDGLFDVGPADAAGVPDAEGSRPHLHYDEWDGRKRCYRSNWCTLYLEPQLRAAAPRKVAARRRQVRVEHAAQLRELRALLEALDTERRWRAGQLDGAELDLDAIVDRQCARAAGHAGHERVYATRRRHARELATLILIDLSLSSDSFVAGRRILDIAQDAMLILGDVLDHTRDEFAIAGFFSHTRRDCRWLTLKSFEQPWSDAVGRLLAMQPTGYTRIGPALRHGVHTLAGHGARRRLLLLITDGRPTDYDHYEGRHGVEDVRQAFREAEQQAIHPFALTLADASTPLLVRLFGPAGFETLDAPSRLAHALTDLYIRLARN